MGAIDKYRKRSDSNASTTAAAVLKISEASVRTVERDIMTAIAPVLSVGSFKSRQSPEKGWRV